MLRQEEKAVILSLDARNYEYVKMVEEVIAKISMDTTTKCGLREVHMLTYKHACNRKSN